MIRRLIVPLTAAAVIVHAGHVFAQGAFPAPLPNQSAAPANASPFPPVNGRAPAASPFPSQGAAPFTGGNGEAFAGAARWLGNGAGNALCANTCPA